MTLLNEGYSPSDFEDKPVKVDEISKVAAAVEEDVQPASEPEVVSTVTETANEGEPTVEDAILAERQLPQPSKPKVRKKKNDKSDNK